MSDLIELAGSAMPLRVDRPPISVQNALLASRLHRFRALPGAAEAAVDGVRQGWVLDELVQAAAEPLQWGAMPSARIMSF